ncbi:uncharacterized protein METZ01_LOCUS341588, partial [marine metagenome]
YPDYRNRINILYGPTGGIIEKSRMAKQRYHSSVFITSIDSVTERRRLMKVGGSLCSRSLFSRERFLISGSLYSQRGNPPLSQ